MFDKLKQFNKMRKMQSEIKKELEQLFTTYDKNGIKVVVRGDKKIERLTIDDEEQKALKEAINDALKDMDKKVEKQMRGRLDDLGLGGL